MKTIGLIGGMSWESTVPYYQTINQVVAEALGGLHSAQILLASVDFHEVEELQREERWDEAGDLLADVARRLERAGAELLLICTNTMHVVAGRVERGLGIPLLHIADATGAEVRDAGISRVGLLGTRFTMERDFYRRRLEERFGLEVSVPDASAREGVHRVIYDELCRGLVLAESRAGFIEIAGALAEGGAQGIILGCTEIAMLLGDGDAPVPMFDTAAIHARRGARVALGEIELPVS